VAAIADLRAAVEAEGGPDDAGALLCFLIERLSARIAISVAEMDDHGDACEEEVLHGNAEALTSEVGDLRAVSVDIRRVLIPQRDAVSALKRAALPMIAEEDRLRLDEAEDVLRRLVEEIEALRDRLVVLTDEIASQRSERLNRNLYILSVVSVIFLPLGFLTGLMGINVAGLPGANWPPAFWTFCAILAVILAAQVCVLWWMRILRFPSRDRRSRLLRQEGKNARRRV
jgi:zinc transporter